MMSLLLDKSFKACLSWPVMVNFGGLAFLRIPTSLRRRLAWLEFKHLAACSDATTKSSMGSLSEATAKLKPFTSKDVSTEESSCLEALMTNFFNWEPDKSMSSLYWRRWMSINRCSLYPFHAGHPGDHPGDSPGDLPGDIPFTLARGLPGEFVSSALVQRKYVYGACIQSPRAPELSWKKRKHSIGIWRMHIHFARFVLWRNNDRPDFTREFNRDAFHAATSPGCTRVHPGVYPGRFEGNISKKSSGILPGISPERPFTLRYHPGAPGCTRVKFAQRERGRLLPRFGPGKFLLPWIV